MKTISELRQKILKQSEKTGINFNSTLALIAYERVLSRLIANPILKEAVIFKGGIIMRLAYGSERFTKDLDASFEGISIEKLKSEVQEALHGDEDDGFRFECRSWKAITEEKDYSGYRLSVDYFFGSKKIQVLQMDFTLSEIMNAFVQKKLNFDFQPYDICFKVYPPELIIAEKLQTVMVRGETNTRAKDIYDINYLMNKKINSKKLKTHIEKVFEVRQTALPKSFQKFVNSLAQNNLRRSWDDFEKAFSTGLTFSKIWAEFKENINEIENLFTPKPT